VSQSLGNVSQPVMMDALLQPVGAPTPATNLAFSFWTVAIRSEVAGKARCTSAAI
jgi:hypothetical protein